MSFFSFSEEAPPLCAATRSVEESEDQHRCHRTVCLKTDEEPVELQTGDHTTTHEEHAGMYPISHALHQGVDNGMCSNFSDVTSTEHASSTDSSEASNDQISIDEGDVGQYFFRNETHLMLFDSVQRNFVIQKLSYWFTEACSCTLRNVEPPNCCSPATKGK